MLLVAAATLAAVAQPRAELLPLPADLIDLNSSRGEVLLSDTGARGDYASLNTHFTAQINRAFCGPASIAMVLNALGDASRGSDGHGLFDQESVFSARAEAVKPRAEVWRSGMTLNELGAVLTAHDLRAEVRHTADSSLDEFRRRAAAALDREDEFVLVNYLRWELGQRRGGHISLLAA